MILPADTFMLQGREEGARDPGLPRINALPSQLGLKLVPGTAELQVLVIDAVTKPTEN